jgi:hypothetical protein
MRGEYYTQLRNLVGGMLYGSPKPLPAQFTGKRQLLEALLLDAVRTFHVYMHARKPSARQRFDEVETWVASEDTEYVFSFVNVCTLLGLDADAVRTHLMAWKASQAAASTRELAASKPQFRIVQR